MVEFLKKNIVALSPEGSEFIYSEIYRYRWQMLGFLVLGFIAALIEMTGVGLVFPLLIVLVEPSYLDRIPYVPEILDRLDLASNTHVSIILIVMIGAVMVGKNGYMLFFYWLQMRTLTKWKTVLSKRLMQTYIYSDYQTYLSKSSSEIIRNIALVPAIFDQFLTALMNIAINIVMLIGLCVVLFFVLPPETLFSLILIAVVSVAVYYLLKKPFETIGEELNRLFERRQSILRQSIGMIRETKLTAKEDYFLDAFVGVERRSFGRQAHYNFMSTIPPLVTESAVILAILAIVTYILFFSGKQDVALAILGLLAATLFRLAPVINRIMSSLQLMNISRNTVDIIAREFRELEHKAYRPTTEPAPLPFRSQIAFENVSFAYPNSDLVALEDLNLELAKGEMVGITGPSGAGKSTFAALVMALMPPTRGTIRVDDTVLDDPVTVRAWHKQIGFVPQSVFMIDDSIARNVAFGHERGEMDEERVWRALEIVQLREFAESLPNGIHEFAGEDGSRLSGGQRQRMGIARVLYDMPQVMILDEATSALDNVNERAFTDSLQRIRGERTLVIIAHRLSTLRDCDRIIMLDRGRLLDVAPFETLQDRCAPFRRLVELSSLERSPMLIGV